jgi:nucleotide-binding universal stress UspA family protein
MRAVIDPGRDAEIFPYNDEAHVVHLNNPQSIGALNMQSISTILAAIDLESGSNAVLTRALQLASFHAARLIVLHVIEGEPLPQTAAALKLGEGELQEQLKRHALATIEPLIVESGRTRRTETQVEFGAPHDVIARLARDRSADLIVIGPGKGRSLKETILGSTADRVIRTSHVPVPVVRSDSAAPYRHIAVAVDFSPQSEAAAREAQRLAPDAGVQLVHAIDIPLPFQQAMLRAGTPQAEIEIYRGARADRAREELASFARGAGGLDGAATPILEGKAGSALVRLSRGGPVDLLAMGPHGRGVIRQALLGSVTQRVLREAECDVLVTTSW